MTIIANKVTCVEYRETAVCLGRVPEVQVLAEGTSWLKLWGRTGPRARLDQPDKAQKYMGL